MSCGIRMLLLKSLQLSESNAVLSLYYYSFELIINFPIQEFLDPNYWKITTGKFFDENVFIIYPVGSLNEKKKEGERIPSIKLSDSCNTLMYVYSSLRSFFQRTSFFSVHCTTLGKMELFLPSSRLWRYAWKKFPRPARAAQTSSTRFYLYSIRTAMYYVYRFIRRDAPSQIHTCIISSTILPFKFRECSLNFYTKMCFPFCLWKFFKLLLGLTLSAIFYCGYQ